MDFNKIINEIKVIEEQQSQLKMKIKDLKNQLNFKLDKRPEQYQTLLFQDIKYFWDQHKERTQIEKKIMMEVENSNSKPQAKIIGEDSNIFNLMAICKRALIRNNQKEEAKKMIEEILICSSYEIALCILGKYCDLI